MNTFDEFVFREFLVEKFDFDERQKPANLVRFEAEQNVGELLGWASDILFGRIVYEKDEKMCATESLAVKRSKEADAFSETEYYSMQLTNEIHFFSKVVPTLNALSDRNVESFFPTFLYSCTKAMPGHDRSVLIYENLRTRDFHTPTLKKVHRKDSSSEKDIDLSTVFLDYPHLSLMMRKLGQFHAHSIAALKTNPNHVQFIANFIPHFHEYLIRKYSNLMRVLMKKSIRLLSANPHYASKLTFFENIVENLETSLLNVNRIGSTAVICHGDYTVSNMLFKYDENGGPVDMKMLDLGLWRLSSPVLDLAHLLYIDADQEMRDRHWDDLMNDYFDGMGDILTADHFPSRQKIVDEFRLNSWYAVLVASFFLSSRIAALEKLPSPLEVILSHHPHVLPVNVSTQQLQKVIENYDVFSQKGTEAVLNIIKDMIDRKFL